MANTMILWSAFSAPESAATMGSSWSPNLIFCSSYGKRRLLNSFGRGGSSYLLSLWIVFWVFNCREVSKDVFIEFHCKCRNQSTRLTIANNCSLLQFGVSLLFPSIFWFCHVIVIPQVFQHGRSSCLQSTFAFSFLEKVTMSVALSRFEIVNVQLTKDNWSALVTTWKFDGARGVEQCKLLVGCFQSNESVCTSRLFLFFFTKTLIPNVCRLGCVNEYSIKNLETFNINIFQ